MTFSDRIRTYVTRFLIRLAMKTCVWGFTYDYLEQALKAEFTDD